MDILYGEDAHLVYEAVKSQDQGLTRIYLDGAFPWENVLSEDDHFLFEKPVYACYVLKTPQKQDIQALKKIASSPDNPIHLLIFPEMHFQEMKSTWFADILKLGNPKKIITPRGKALKAFIDAKARAWGLSLDEKTLRLLSETFENRIGDLIQTLQVAALTGSTAWLQDMPLTHAGVFALERFCQANDYGKALQALDSLEAEGVEPALVLWAMARGFSGNAPVSARSFQLATIDWMIKGVYPGNPWVAMRWFVLQNKDYHE